MVQAIFFLGVALDRTLTPRSNRNCEAKAAPALAATERNQRAHDSTALSDNFDVREEKRDLHRGRFRSIRSVNRVFSK